MVGVVLILSSFAPLHHGWSSYDQTKTLKFTGKILEMGTIFEIRAL